MRGKLFSFDFDGTLVDSTGVLSDEMLKAIDFIKSLGGIIIVLAGRTRLSHLILNQLPLDAYAVCNGARVYVNDKCIASPYIDDSDVYKIISLLNKSQRFYLFFEGMKFSERNEAFLKSRGEILFRNIRTRKYNRVYSMLIEDINFEMDIESLKDSFPQYKVSVGSHPRNHEIIIDPFGRKIDALNLIIKEFRLEMKDVVAFGDGDNDIEILSSAGVAVQIGCRESLDKICKYRIEDQCKLPKWLIEYAKNS